MTEDEIRKILHMQLTATRIQDSLSLLSDASPTIRHYLDKRYLTQLKDAYDILAHMRNALIADIEKLVKGEKK